MYHKSAVTLLASLSGPEARWANVEATFLVHLLDSFLPTHMNYTPNIHSYLGVNFARQMCLANRSFVHMIGSWSK